jgi:MOSC domain-containing protein YiiM
VKIISVNVGLPQEIEWRGRKVRTSIWKTSKEGPVRVRRLNLDGDRQSDLSVHGGPEKAVYVYPSEHYEHWGREFPGTGLPCGAFGENFTTEGILERDVRIGDSFRVGSAEFRVTQPRMPCYKLGLRFNRDDIIKRFLRGGRTGFYLAVLREGEVARGDSIEFTDRNVHNVTVADIVSLYGHDADNESLLRRAVELPGLPENWREYFRKRLWEPDT